VRPLHCLIADIPQAVLVDIVQRVAEESENIKVVDRVSDLSQLPVILASQPIDVLIIGMKKFMLPQICTDMMEKFSNLLVVGLVNDGRKAAIYLNEISSGEVADIINMLGRR
jgi:hypothetical protein